MATKVKLTKFLQNASGFPEVGNRPPAPHSPILYLTQLRSHVMASTHPKRKLISIQLQSHPELEFPVKITHL